MTIFIAEDNPADVYLLRIAFSEAERQNVELIVATDGEEAIDYVEHRRAETNCVKPDLFVLDLNLPKNDGSEILRSIRKSPEYADVPVVVLTSSDSPRDRQSAEELGADCYLTKPSDLGAFLELGGTLLSFAGVRRGRCASASQH
jgi:CheY-like chemotaxis protein